MRLFTRMDLNGPKNWNGLPEWPLTCAPEYFICTLRTEWLKVATERDLTEKYSVWVPKRLTPYGGVATGAHITAWVNAAVP